MLQYPEPLRDYPMEWIEDLRRFKDKEALIRIEKKDVFPFIKEPSLVAFYSRVKELIELPSTEEYPPMPEEPWTWLHMIPKKQHEIRRLAPHVNHLYQNHKVSCVVDIGGGIGFLAQTLNNQYRMKVTSIDMNADFQRTGMERHEKNAKDPLNKVTYQNIKVENGGKFAELLSHNVLPVGLHTCGKLALDIIKVSADKKVPALVNFGCCYQTLDASPEFQNISRFAKENDPIWMNKYALTLACRAHKKMNEKDLDFKQKVKYMRYAFHILLHDYYGIREIVNLGNSHPKLYDRPFSDYAQEQFRRINIEPKHTPEELNAFYSRPDIQLIIDQMLTAGHIRNAFGRVMEIYLLLDRAIYLEEQGYNVSVQEFFDEELSPRNIGITARLP